VKCSERFVKEQAKLVDPSFIWFLCFILSLWNMNHSFFQPNFFKFWVICVHVSLRIVNSSKLLKFACTCCYFKNMLLEIQKLNFNGNRKTR
jgi:hypothetical protein